MAYQIYSNEKLTEVCRLLLEMRDNCISKDDQVYNDPERKEKYEALNIALSAIDQIPWGNEEESTFEKADFSPVTIKDLMKIIINNDLPMNTPIMSTESEDGYARLFTSASVNYGKENSQPIIELY